MWIEKRKEEDGDSKVTEMLPGIARNSFQGLLEIPSNNFWGLGAPGRGAESPKVGQKRGRKKEAKKGTAAVSGRPREK